MDRKFLFILLGLLVAAQVIQAQVLFKKGSCPRRKTVYHCEPTCMNDYQCPSSQKCCPNKCGSVSCVEASPVYTGNNGPYRGIIKHSHVFCGGMKCTKWEKCELERNTKRARCVRV